MTMRKETEAEIKNMIHDQQEVCRKEYGVKEELDEIWDFVKTRASWKLLAVLIGLGVVGSGFSGVQIYKTVDYIQEGTKERHKIEAIANENRILISAITAHQAQMDSLLNIHIIQIDSKLDALLKNSLPMPPLANLHKDSPE